MYVCILRFSLSLYIYVVCNHTLCIHYTHICATYATCYVKVCKCALYTCTMPIIWMTGVKLWLQLARRPPSSTTTAPAPDTSRVHSECAPPRALTESPASQNQQRVVRSRDAQPECSGSGTSEGSWSSAHSEGTPCTAGHMQPRCPHEVHCLQSPCTNFKGPKVQYMSINFLQHMILYMGINLLQNISTCTI